LKVHAYTTERGIATDPSGLPEGVRNLLALATAVPERTGAARRMQRTSVLARIGLGVVRGLEGATAMLAFVGEAVLMLLRFLVGQARFRRSDLVQIIQECGARALGIVSLISFLIGLILA